MSLSLKQLGDLVGAVATERRIPCELVGVTRTSTDASYTEVVLDVRASNGALKRVVLGLHRRKTTAALRIDISEQLTDVLGLD